LPHLVDGLTESRRKVLWTVRHKFGTSDATNKKLKVAALAADTAKMTAYIHGEQCIADTIVLMAQSFPGSNNLPMLKPRGYFGGRTKGGKDAASPRYIYTELNQKLCYAMFPSEDDYILDFVFDEGFRCEPKYFVPILPMIVLESLSGNIGVGWSCQIWARDINSVIKNVRAMINGTQTNCRLMKTWMKSNKGKIMFDNGREYSVGVYEFNEKKNTIHVSELPMGMYPHSFLEWDKEKQKPSDDEYSGKKKMPLWANELFTQKPLCETNKEINITFYLKKNAIDQIREKYPRDPIVSFLNLRNVLNSNINVIGPDDSVIEFKQYNEPVDAWFKIRKSLYEKRIMREIVLLEMEILYLENITRYMDNETKYKFTTTTELEYMVECLTKDKYQKINETVLRSPKYTPVDILKKEILSGSAASYTYLLSLNNLDRSAGRSKKRQESLNQKKSLLKELRKPDPRFPGASLWIRELDALEKILTEGFKNNWGTDDNKQPVKRSKK
jgi:DNA topoisomerase-2